MKVACLILILTNGHEIAEPLTNRMLPSAEIVVRDEVEFAEALASSPVSTISLGADLKLTQSVMMDLHQGLVVNGRGFTISGDGGTFPCLVVSGTKGVVLSQLILTSCGGGAVYVTGSDNLMATACQFRNSSSTQGGGLFSYASTVTVEESVVAHNKGSGIYVSGGALRMEGVHFLHNRGQGGAGLYVDSADVDCHRCSFKGNEATGNGGGIGLYNAQLELVDSGLQSNRAAQGGALFSYSSAARLDLCTVDSSAPAAGGGLYFLQSRGNVTASAITGLSPLLVDLSSLALGASAVRAAAGAKAALVFQSGSLKAHGLTLAPPLISGGSASAARCAPACPPGTLGLCPLATGAPLCKVNCVCSACAAGRYAAPSASACSLCPPGTFSSPSSAAQAKGCTPCAAGKFAAASASAAGGGLSEQVALGAVACAPCPPGTFSAARAFLCRGCSAGSSSAAAASSCAPCPPGHFSEIGRAHV